jgi:hypothetical protein
MWVRRRCQRPAAAGGLTRGRGTQGAGKGTVSDKLVRDFGFAHVATGDLLRLHIYHGSELGTQAAAYMKAGGTAQPPPSKHTPSTPSTHTCPARLWKGPVEEVRDASA